MRNANNRELILRFSITFQHCVFSLRFLSIILHRAGSLFIIYTLHICLLAFITSLYVKCTER